MVAKRNETPNRTARNSTRKRCGNTQPGNDASHRVKHEQVTAIPSNTLTALTERAFCFMPSFVINNLTAPDNYIVIVGPPPTPPVATTPSTLDLLPICDHVNIDVLNSPILWAVKEARQPWGMEQQGDWQVEVFMVPGSRTIYNRGGGIIGFRFRAYVLAANIVAPQLQAQVTIEAVQ